ncbi:LacI family DNA-binding transcriptional regulator [Salibacterium aidingense]|uniref:LacI family DNA-binding transcriptional regulator n=1 Tax=Salibacterium aidingense TaxID=384933 RepID=UPI003BCFAE0B
MKKRLKMKDKTIKDVAKKAGVSISTVSRVLNGYGNVNKETNELVRKAVEEVGYSPNAIARSLRSRSTKTIGLIVNNILNPIYSLMAQAIEDTAREYGYQLLLCNSGANSEYEKVYLDGLYEKKVDGIIIAPTGQNKEKINSFIKSGIPVIQVDRVIEGLEADAVVTNNRSAAYEMVSRIIENGYKKIALIVGVQTITTGMERMTGYFSALAENNINANSEYIKVGHFDENTGFDAMNELLSLPNPPEAVFVCNNLMAKGAMMAVRENNISIPSQLSFCMFDDPDWAAMNVPSITAVKQPTYEIGTKAAKLLINRVNNQNKEQKPVHEVIDSKIIIRDSM